MNTIPSLRAVVARRYQAAFRAALTASLILALGACASFKPLSEIPGVEALDWELREDQSGSGLLADPVSLVPGRTYTLTVKYLQRSSKGTGTWKNLINYRDVVLAPSDVSWTVAGRTVTAPADPFAALAEGGASLTVNFPGTSFERVEKRVRTVLSRSLPSFRGTDGEAGASGTESSPSGVNGKSGTDGKNLDLEIARYDTTRTVYEYLGYALLVRDANSGRIWLLERKPASYVVDAAGGDGGNGGDGADRKIPEGSDETFLQGGKGGSGGDGGRGGLVRFIQAPNSDVDTYFVASVSGGRSGKGGSGGTGDRKKSDNLLAEIVSAFIINGSDGDEGRPGTAGRSWREQKPLEELFLGVQSPLFDRSRLLP